MGYKRITKYDSPNFTPAREAPAVFGYPRQILSATIHHWGDPANWPTFMGTIRHLCRVNGNTSAHSVVEAGRVAEVINYADVAWGNGSAYGNATSLVIEINPQARAGDWRTAAEYIADLWMFYGKLPLFEHNDWTATACPGRYTKARMAKKANAYYAKKLAATQKTKTPILTKPKAPKPDRDEAPKPVKKAKGLFWIVEPGDTLSAISDYYYGTPTKWRKIARHNDIKNPAGIRAGQRIAIPGPLYWRVERGDNLEKIADYFGIPNWRTVQHNAGISDPQTLRVGQLIRVY